MSPLTRAKVLFLLAAFISFLLSVSLWFLGHKEQGQFVGLWVPSILALGAFTFAGREGALMPEIILFAIGTVVMIFTVLAVVAVGRAGADPAGTD